MYQINFKTVILTQRASSYSLWEKYVQNDTEQHFSENNTFIKKGKVSCSIQKCGCAYKKKELASLYLIDKTKMCFILFLYKNYTVI